MARPKKKESVSTTFRMDENVYNRLNKYSEETGQPKVTAVERAVTMFIDDYEQKQKIIAGQGK